MKIQERIPTLPRRPIGLAVSLIAFISTALILITAYEMGEALQQDYEWLFNVHCVMMGFLVVGSVVATKDKINPLVLLVFVAHLRFFVPYWVGRSSFQDVHLFATMGIVHPSQWVSSALLAALGVAAFGTVFIVSCGGAPNRAQRANAATQTVLWGWFTVGLLSLLVFVGLNTGIGAALESGSMRTTEIGGGTGYFFYVGLLAIPASVLLFSAYIVNGQMLSSLAAITLYGLFFAVLGGRVRALVPMLMAAWVYWYLISKMRASLRIVVAAALTMPILVIMFVILGQFRFGGGLQAALNIENLSEHIVNFLTVELGQLHPIAGAQIIGEGYLGAGAFSDVLWPANKFISIGDGEHAGVFIARHLVGFDYAKREWGFHPTLIGQSYLVFGLGGVLGISAIAGCVSGLVYRSFRQGVLSVELNVLLQIHIMLIYFQSTGIYSQLAASLICYGVIVTSQRFFSLRR